MKIKVLFPNGVGYVDAKELNGLIASKRIMAFYRSNGLVVVGIHKTRRRNEERQEPERRSGTNG